MKKIRNLCLILLLSIVTIFCVTACNPNSNGDGGGDNPSNRKVSFEITVDASKVSVDASAISVCVYSLDGTLVVEKKLSRSKALFELDADSYVATLSGLSDEVSYSSVLLTKSSKKATIVLENTEYDKNSEAYEFVFTVFALPGEIKLDDLDVQVCDDSMCKTVWFEDGNTVNLNIKAGKYLIKVGVYTDDGLNELYKKDYTITLDRRFCIVDVTNEQVL
ncbi:MAG: hypothetical protein J1F65_01435 [Clostridiales bacterium]|nr:hypothetical protein [Clostridiales bacterium]